MVQSNLYCSVMTYMAKVEKKFDGSSKVLRFAISA